MKRVDHWFKMNLFLDGKNIMIIKMIQGMTHQAQNQMSHSNKET